MKNKKILQIIFALAFIALIPNAFSAVACNSFSPDGSNTICNITSAKTITEFTVNSSNFLNGTDIFKLNIKRGGSLTTNKIQLSATAKAAGKKLRIYLEPTISGVEWGGYIRNYTQYLEITATSLEVNGGNPYAAGGWAIYQANKITLDEYLTLYARGDILLRTFNGVAPAITASNILQYNSNIWAENGTINTQYYTIRGRGAQNYSIYTSIINTTNNIGFYDSAYIYPHSGGTTISVGGIGDLIVENSQLNLNGGGISVAKDLEVSGSYGNVSINEPSSIIVGNTLTIGAGTRIDRAAASIPIKAATAIFYGINTSGWAGSFKPIITSDDITFASSNFTREPQDLIALQPKTGSKIGNLSMLNSSILVPSNPIYVNNLSLNSGTISGVGSVTLYVYNPPTYSGSSAINVPARNGTGYSISLHYAFEGTATVPNLHAPNHTQAKTVGDSAITITGPASKNLNLTVNSVISADGEDGGCGAQGGKITLDKFNNIAISRGIQANGGTNNCGGAYYANHIGGNISIKAMGEITFSGNGAVSASGGWHGTGYPCDALSGKVLLQAAEITANYSAQKSMFENSCGGTDNYRNTLWTAHHGIADVTISNTGNLTLTKAIAKLNGSPMSGSSTDSIIINNSDIEGLTGALNASDKVEISNYSNLNGTISSVSANKIILSSSYLQSVSGNITANDYIKTTSSRIYFTGSANQEINPHANSASELYITENNSRTFNSSNSYYYSPTGSKNVRLSDNDNLTIFSNNDTFGSSSGSETYNIQSCSITMDGCQITGGATVRVSYGAGDVPDCTTPAGHPDQFVATPDILNCGSGGGGGPTCASILVIPSGSNVNVEALFTMGGSTASAYNVDCSSGGTASNIVWNAATAQLTGKCNYGSDGTFILKASITSGGNLVYCQAQTVVCSGSTCTIVGGGGGGGGTPVPAELYVNAFILDSSSKTPITGNITAKVTDPATGATATCTAGQSISVTNGRAVSGGKFNCDLVPGKPYNIELTIATGTTTDTFTTTIKG